jgi:hypothetical protein
MVSEHGLVSLNQFSYQTVLLCLSLFHGGYGFCNYWLWVVCVMHRFVSFLFPIVVVSFLSACGSGEQPLSVISAPIVPNSPPSSGGDSTTVHETITTPLLIGKSTQLTLQFPGGHACVDGTTPIQWTLTADASRAAISQTNICRPVLTTTAQFQGEDATIEARLRRADGKLIRWTTLVRFKRTPEITTGLVARNRASWGSVSVPATTGNFREVSIQGIQTAQMVTGTYLSTGVADGTVIFWEGENRNNNRRFEIPIQYQDLDGDRASLVVSASCKMNDPTRQRFMLECPFEFEAVDDNNPVVKFQFKQDMEAAPFPGNTSLFRVKNVFRGSSNQYSLIDVYVEVRHPNTSEVARRTIGQIALYTHAFY